MKKAIGTIVLVSMLLVSGCAAVGSDDLFSYKNTKIGDVSNVSRIIEALPGNEPFEAMELQTDNEPYEMTTFYETTKGEFTDQMMLHNATVQFALIPNADIITFVVDGEKHTVKREVLEDWYDAKLDNIKTEEELAELEKNKPANDGEISMIFER